jgi:transposase InsO family protein
MCQLLDVSRSGYYAWLTRPISQRQRRNQVLLREIVRLHEKYPSLGLDGLYHILRRSHTCSRGRVHRLMKKAGIHSTRKAGFKVTTNSRHNLPIAPNLLNRNFHAATPNAAWVSDITYIRTGEGWLYLAIILDLCTRKVIGYALSIRVNTTLVLDALAMAIRRQRPAPGLIFHSDRGVQYASAAFRAALAAAGIRQSMSRKGDPYDNAVAESFFSCLKCEALHLAHFVTHNQAADAVFAYIEAFYNTVRPHSKISWLSPAAFEKFWFSQIPA